MPAEGWVNFMESHDEERVAYKQTAFGNLQNAGLDIRMKQLARLKGLKKSSCLKRKISIDKK